MSEVLRCRFVVVGGGIAGISCVESLLFHCPLEDITLITESSMVKKVINPVALAKSLMKFDVEEQHSTSIDERVRIIVDKVVIVKHTERVLITCKGININYQYLCICTGARPKLVQQNNNYVIGIRDTESVQSFQSKLKTARRIVLIGNGGIASEIAYELKNIEVDWVIRDDYISSIFVDEAAAKFLKSRLERKSSVSGGSIVKRIRYIDVQGVESKGPALGPDWHRLLDMSNKTNCTYMPVRMHYKTEVKSIEVINSEDTNSFPVKVQLSNDITIMCDFVVSATGVIPQIDFEIDEKFETGPDGAIVVNELMQTNLQSIYAAGDVCYAGWQRSKHWFQMRLWTQAKQMGGMAGLSMSAALNNYEIQQDFCFELFGHVTKLFGYQLILLGNYNGQGLGTNYEILLRITPDNEYVKFILQNGKLQGAILIGETGLEETCENLILNQLDLTSYGDNILNPGIDIEDYFD